jgi:hypothetical protein
MSKCEFDVGQSVGTEGRRGDCFVAEHPDVSDALDSADNLSLLCQDEEGEGAAR